MDVPLQYKKYVDEAARQFQNGFPQSFIGMHDSGVDYLFGLLNKNEEIKKEQAEEKVLQAPLGGRTAQKRHAARNQDPGQENFRKNRNDR